MGINTGEALVGATKLGNTLDVSRLRVPTTKHRAAFRGHRPGAATIVVGADERPSGSATRS